MVEIIGETKAIFEELTSVGLGVAGGFIGGAMVGRYVENLALSGVPVAPGDTLTRKLYGWAANNLPKIAIWYLLRKYNATTEITRDLDKALIGSVAFDSLLRATNNGINTATAYIGPYQIMSGSPAAPANQGQIQQMAQEINVLRTELKKAMQIAAQPPFGAPPQYNPVNAGAPVVTPYVEGAPLPAPATRRATRMGFMEQGYISGAPYPVPAQPNPPIAQDRQASFGFMTEQKAGLSKAAAMCGMQ